MARDPRRRPARAAQDVPHLLPRGVFRLSPPARQRPGGPGGRRIGARAGELRSRAAVSRRRRTHVRYLGEQPVRPAPLRDLLQDLYREGLGHAVLGDQRGVGCPANQEPRSDDRDQECAARQPRRRRPGGHQSHRALSLSASRARHDVGAVPGHGGGRRRAHPPEYAGRPDPARWRPGARRRRPRPGWRHAARALRRADLDHARGRSCPRHGPYAARRGAGRRREAAAQGLSHRGPDRGARSAVPGQLDLRPRSGGSRRPRAEFQELEPRHGRRPGRVLHRARVLRQPGRCALEPH